MEILDLIDKLKEEVNEYLEKNQEKDERIKNLNNELRLIKSHVSPPKGIVRRPLPNPTFRSNSIGSFAKSNTNSISNSKFLGERAHWEKERIKSSAEIVSLQAALGEMTAKNETNVDEIEKLKLMMEEYEKKEADYTVEINDLKGKEEKLLGQVEEYKVANINLEEQLDNAKMHFDEVLLDIRAVMEENTRLEVDFNEKKILIQQMEEEKRQILIEVQNLRRKSMDSNHFYKLNRSRSKKKLQSGNGNSNNNKLDDNDNVDDNNEEKDIKLIKEEEKFCNDRNDEDSNDDEDEDSNDDDSDFENYKDRHLELTSRIDGLRAENANLQAQYDSMKDQYTQLAESEMAARLELRKAENRLENAGWVTPNVDEIMQKNTVLRNLLDCTKSELAESNSKLLEMEKNKKQQQILFQKNMNEISGMHLRYKNSLNEYNLLKKSLIDTAASEGIFVNDDALSINSNIKETEKLKKLTLIPLLKALSSKLPSVLKSSSSTTSLSSSASLPLSDVKMPMLPAGSGTSSSMVIGAPMLLPKRSVSQFTAGKKLPANIINLESKKEKFKDEASRELATSLRCRIIDEIFITEQEYLKNMDELVSQFLNPLKKLAPINSQEIYTIFSNTDVLTKMTRELLASLKKNRPKSESNLRNSEIYDNSVSGNKYMADNTILIAQIFLDYSVKLKSYAKYCSNQSHAIEVLAELRQNKPDFDEFINNVEKSKNVSLLNLLHKPTQRLCRYALLLKELLKFTDPNDDGHKTLELAVSKIEDVTLFVNNEKRKVETLGKFKTIERTYQGISENFELVDSDRHFICGTDLCILSSKGKLKKRHIELFNDVLLIAVKLPLNIGKKRFHLKKIILWSSGKVTNVPKSLYENALSVKLLETGNSNPVEYVMVFNDLYSKQLWLGYFEEIFQFPLI